MSNVLQKYISRQVKNLKRIDIAPQLGNRNQSINFDHAFQSKYTQIPVDSNDRLKRMQQIKSKTDLSFLITTPNPTIINGTRNGSTGGLVFNKVNPVRHLNNDMTPNSVQYTLESYGNRIPSSIRAESKQKVAYEIHHKQVLQRIEEEKEKLNH